MSDWGGLAWLVVLLVANAFFVGGEFAVISARRFFIDMMSCAWVWMSLDVPPKPPCGWCSSTRALGVMYRLPLVPAVSSSWPIEAAMPIATVATSLGIHCMTSKIAMPARFCNSHNQLLVESVIFAQQLFKFLFVNFSDEFHVSVS